MECNYKVKGCVEALMHSKILCGWSYITNDDKEIFSVDEIIVHHKSGEVLGQGVAKNRRPDLDAVQPLNQFGFHIELLRSIGLDELSKCIVSIKLKGSVLKQSLSLSKKLASNVRKSIFNGELKKLKSSYVKELDQHELKMIDDLLNHERTSNTDKLKVTTLSEVAIGEGSISPKNIAIAGKKGHFFLFSGSNNLDKLYERKQSDIYNKWIALILQRKKQAKLHNTKFVQLIIPEKQSVVPELYPLPIQSPTENLELLEAEARRCSLPDLISLTNTYKVANKEDIFRKTDTHFSLSGAKLTVSSILKYFNIAMPELAEIENNKLMTGDVGNKFAGPDFFEEVKLANTKLQPNLIEKVDPGKHIGIVRKWVNPSAPYKMKVIAFGNSFFERGDSSTGLSWWFARLFEEFHFYWSVECDWELVQKEAPEIVICQTIERFLPRVPSK